LRLEAFYVQHGFERVGEPYPEDGIPHLEMFRRASLSGKPLKQPSDEGLQ
jgi:predicted GNAT family N-acyltransferase